MTWEEYKKFSQPKVATACIHKSGFIGFSKSAIEMLRSSTKNEDIWVELLFDYDEEAVGVRIVEPDSKNGYKLKKSLIHSTGFVNYYRLKEHRSQMFPLVDFGDNIFGFTITSRIIK